VSDIRIIHVTDIHFAKDTIDQSRSMIRYLGEDLAKYTDGEAEPILLITGDVAYQGSSADQYEAFYKAYEEYIEPLGVKVCCIPGNHDISQKYIKDNYAMLLGISDNISDLVKLNAYLDKNEAPFRDAMEEYIGFEEVFAELSTCQNSIYGQGYLLNGGFGIYCVNSGFYSFAGHKIQGRENDHGRLLCNVGSIKKWINDNPNVKNRIIAFHHPLEWFRYDVRKELENIISNNFGLALFGHMHEASPIRSSTPTSNTLMCQGGALSSSDTEKLFYQIIDINTENASLELTVRHFSKPNQRFVSGSTVTGTDDGTIVYSNLWKEDSHQKHSESIKFFTNKMQLALKSPAQGCEPIYVPPSITDKPMFSRDRNDEVKNYSVSSLEKIDGDIVIHCPSQYGGSVLAIEFAIECLRQGSKCIILSADTTPSYKAKLDPYLELKVKECKLSAEGKIKVVILDDYDSQKRDHNRTLTLLKTELSCARFIVINRLHAASRDGSPNNPIENAQAFYLNALSRSKVRQIIAQHPSNYEFTVDDDISSHILDEIERLNLHRVPFNVIMLMELISNNRNFNPLNRAKLVENYFELVFKKKEDSVFYDEGMDFDDRMHFLTRFTSSLVESATFTFDEKYWIDFCDQYHEDFGPKLSPSEELKIYLAANIFVKNDNIYHFRLSMWTWYFLANRVVEDVVFRDSLLDSRKYQSYPQVLEFATGINRKQTDLLSKLELHLDQAISDYEEESGLNASFVPYDHMAFRTDDENIESFHTDLAKQVLANDSQREIIDAGKDENYDYSAPFQQIVHNRVYSANLIKLYRTLEAVGLCVRNSDHVKLDTRMSLTEKYFLGLERFSQAAFCSIPDMVTKGRAVVSGIAFIPPSNPPANYNAAAIQIIFCLPPRIVESVIEHMGSAKFWVILSEESMDKFSGLSKYLIISVMSQLRTSGWFAKYLKYLNSLEQHSIFVELISDQFKSSLAYGGFSQEQKHLLEKGYVSTLMKQRGIKNITDAAVEKEHKRHSASIVSEKLSK